MSDHCGPFWFPAWLKRKLSLKFNAACEKHDFTYGVQDKSRSHADSDFLNCMLRSSENKKEALQAFMFFLAVRLLGWISWYRNKWVHFFKSK